MEIFTKSNIRYLRFGKSSAARINLRTGSVDVFLERRLERTPIPRSFAKWSVIVGLEGKNRFPLHSSAVQDRKRIRIFVGRSGTGKTTLLLLHLARGDIVLTDDVLFLGRGEAYPFLFRGNVRKETLSNLRRCGDSVSSRLKAGLIDFASIFPSRLDRVQLNDVAVYYLNVWHSRTSRIQRVNPGRMVGLLTDTYISEMNQSYWFGWRTRERISKVMQVYSNFLENADCYELLAGSDLSQLYNLIQRS
ncbi:MAG: hypothetical protein ABSF00_07185 [Candidatus Bathyarchaeia archaeon]|jgi:hypothetical protein